MSAWRQLLCSAIGASLLPLSSVAIGATHTYTIVIAQLKFGPAPAELHEGDTILWANHDILRHSATALDHSFDVDLPPGATGKTIVKKKGLIAFLCRYHPGMRGILKVK